MVRPWLARGTSKRRKKTPPPPPQGLREEGMLVIGRKNQLSSRAGKEGEGLVCIGVEAGKKRGKISGVGSPGLKVRRQ